MVNARKGRMQLSAQQGSGCDCSVRAASVQQPGLPPVAEFSRPDAGVEWLGAGLWSALAWVLHRKLGHVVAPSYARGCQLAVALPSVVAGWIQRIGAPSIPMGALRRCTGPQLVFSIQLSRSHSVSSSRGGSAS